MRKYRIYLLQTIELGEGYGENDIMILNCMMIEMRNMVQNFGDLSYILSNCHKWIL